MHLTVQYVCILATQKPHVHTSRQPVASLVTDALVTEAASDGRARVVRVQRPVGSEDIDKVKSTLKQVLRDWSALGAPERAACYGPVLAAIERHFPLPRDSLCASPRPITTTFLYLCNVDYSSLRIHFYCTVLSTQYCTVRHTE